MLTLLVQTACNYHQVLLFDTTKGQIVADWHQDTPRETLSFLMHVLSELESHPAFDQIVFIQGPGSFTALRVGATWVNALAFAKKVSVCSLSTLQLAAILYSQPFSSFAITFDQKRFFLMADNEILATENYPSHLRILTPDADKHYLTALHLSALLSLSLFAQPSTEVLYIIPPKITLPAK